MTPLTPGQRVKTPRGIGVVQWVFPARAAPREATITVLFPKERIATVFHPREVRAVH